MSATSKSLLKTIRKHWRNGVDKYLDDFLLPIDGVPQLYHYTTNDSGYKILNERSLRLSKIQHSNDPLDYSFSHKIIREGLKSFNEYGDFLKSTKTYISNITRKHFFEAEKTSKMYTNDLYIGCLSEYSDSLPMWRLYSEDGEGIALCFNTFKHNLFIRRNKEVNYGRIGKVIYDDDEIKSVVDYAIESYAQYYEISRTVGAVPNKEFEIELFFEYAKILDEVCIFSKSKDYAYEKEWRIYVSAKESGKAHPPRISFSKYQKDDFKMRLCEIVCGPAMDAHRYNCLRRQGNMPVKKSRTAYLRR